MYEASRANPAGRTDDGLSYEAYQAARERFLARLRADWETRRLEALWRTPRTPEEEGRTGSHASEATNK
jgi:hypothetical protein